MKQPLRKGCWEPLEGKIRETILLLKIQNVALDYVGRDGKIGIKCLQI